MLSTESHLDKQGGTTRSLYLLDKVVFTQRNYAFNESLCAKWKVKLWHLHCRFTCVTNMALFMPFLSDFDDRMITQSMGLMLLLSEHF